MRTINRRISSQKPVIREEVENLKLQIPDNTEQAEFLDDGSIAMGESASNIGPVSAQKHAPPAGAEQFLESLQKSLKETAPTRPRSRTQLTLTDEFFLHLRNISEISSDLIWIKERCQNHFRVLDSKWSSFPSDDDAPKEIALAARSIVATMTDIRKYFTKAKPLAAKAVEAKSKLKLVLELNANINFVSQRDLDRCHNLLELLEINSGTIEEIIRQSNNIFESVSERNLRANPRKARSECAARSAAPKDKEQIFNITRENFESLQKTKCHRCSGRMAFEEIES